MKPTLALFAGHDANISIYDGEKVYRLEFEKVTHQKHFAAPISLPDTSDVFTNT